MVALAVLLLMPLLSLDVAGWEVDLDTILPVTLFAVVFGWIVARSRFGEVSALIISSLYGVIAIILAAAFNLNLPFREALESVATRVYEWSVDALSDGVNTDELVLTLLAAILFWFLAYNANWHIFRLDRVWRVVLPPGLVLLVNLVFFSGGEPLDVYLFGYLLMALLLIVRSNLDRREWDWYLRGVRVPRNVRRQFAAIGIALSLLALCLAWGVPSGNLQERLNAFQRFLASDPVERLAEVWNRLFAPIEGEGSATTDYYGADLLSLGGAISLGDDVVFTVDAPPAAQALLLAIARIRALCRWSVVAIGRPSHHRSSRAAGGGDEPRGHRRGAPIRASAIHRRRSQRAHLLRRAAARAHRWRRTP